MSDRRNNNERRLQKQSRRSRERRKLTDQSHTVIEIAGADLRVVTLLGSDDESADQVRVMTVRWRIEATTLNSDAGLQELTVALTELAREYDLQTTNLQFSSYSGGSFV